jgi:putative transposase
MQPSAAATAPFVGFTSAQRNPSIGLMAKALRPARAGVSFVTMTTQDRRPIFDISRVAELFTDTLLHYRTLGHYKLHAFVVMPDHVHLLVTPQSITLEQTVSLIRNGFVHRLETRLPIWEDSFIGYSVATMHDLEIVRAYLHQVPVRANLVPTAELYPYSSAYHHSIRDIPMPVVQPDAPLTADSPRKSPKSTTTSLRKIAS